MDIGIPAPQLSKKYLQIHDVLKKRQVLGNFGTRLTFSDEPQFSQYACERYPGSPKGKKSFGFGCGEEDDIAFTIAVSEGVEHYCILRQQPERFVTGTYQQLKNQAMNPLVFVPFSEKQLSEQKYSKFRISDSTRLHWLQGQQLPNSDKVLIPASVVYALFDFEIYDEPMIQISNSTGAACGETVDFAIYKGICEIIERDAYMISCIGKLPKPEICVDGNEELTTFKRRIERYDLEVHFLLTTVDCPITTVLCVILDRTGSGPSVTVGLGGDMDAVHAIKTSGFEAVRRHISARDRFFRNTPLPMPRKYSFDWFLLSKQKIWSMPHMIPKAEELFSDKKIMLEDVPTYPNLTFPNRVKLLIKMLKKIDCKAYFVETTAPEVEDTGLHVVKVLIPEMVPLWRDERYPYLGYRRLWDVPRKLNHAVQNIEKDDAIFSVHPF
jgi:ribosomal protein S12 methylthiotransferase accessory factor